MTPDPLAVAVVDSIDAMPNARWLEPSHGHGAFLRAIRAAGAKRDQVWARDLDHRPVESDRLAQCERGVDFLDPRVFPRAQFNIVVGNPPYLAIERLRGQLRRNAANTLDLAGNPIGENGNLWYAFVCKSMRLLLPGGSIGFVLPASAEFADYARSGRDAIRRHFDAVEVTRFRKPPFRGVSDGSVVLVARGFRTTTRQTNCPWSRHTCESLEDFSVRPPQRADRCPASSRKKSDRIAIGDLAKIQIGAVTGDASYFLLSETKRKDLRLPRSACVPVLSRSKHVGEPILSKSKFDRLLKADERVWLFRPKQSQINHPRIHDYLVNGGCNRDAWKIRNRAPWYETPLPDQADAFVSGMGSGGLVLTLNRMPRLFATNTLFQIKMFESDNDLGALRLAIALLCESSRRQCERLRRHYAGGLRKLEPSDIARVQVPWPVRKPTVTGYRSAVRCVQRGDRESLDAILREMM